MKKKSREKLAGSNRKPDGNILIPIDRSEKRRDKIA
jgi:hypothetical protein